MLKPSKTGDRRSFIGGSDARIVMGRNRSAPAVAGEARRGRAGGSVGQPDRPARDRDRAPEPALVRAQYRADRHGRAAAGGRNWVAILTALGFYAKLDLLPPDVNPSGIPTKYEEEELRQIASALTEAAAASDTMSTAVLVATLLKVSKNANLFFRRELPAPVEWALACEYQRADEPPGTHWRDVWGDQVSSVPGEVEQPTQANIAKAARAALATLQERRKPGRNYNVADQIFADQLGAIFRGSGQPIRRQSMPIMRHGKLVYIEGGGPFYDFLELVLKPLQRYLKVQQLAPVRVASIVRLVTEDFPPSS